MIQILRLLYFINILAINLVSSQYLYNDRNHNQLLSDNLPLNDHKNYQIDGYNQPKSQSYSPEYKEAPMPYQFKYNIDDGYGNKQDRHETADENGNVIGSYGYIDSNGIYRKVDYTAGPEGFVAKINSNEPYLKHQANPAHVTLYVEEPPQNAIKTFNNYANNPRTANTYDDQDNKSSYNDKYDRLFNNQIKNQIYKQDDNTRRQDPIIYDTTNTDINELEQLKPFITMLRPRYTRSQSNTNSNHNIYQSINPNANHYNRNADDIQAYASNRRYYD